MIFSELLPSLRKNLKLKTTNPFFGTLIIVWLFEHWEMFYHLFNFEPNTPTANKISYLKLWLAPEPFLENMLCCIGVSFIVLLLSLLLLYITRAITNIYENRLLPSMYEKTDSTKIVLLEKFKNEVDIRVSVEKNLTELSDKYDKLLIENEKNSKTKNEEINRIRAGLDGARTTLSGKDVEFSRLNNKYNELVDFTNSFGDFLSKNNYMLVDKILFKYIIDSNNVKNFLIIVDSMVNDKYDVTLSNIVQPYIILGLMKVEKENKMILTDLGNKFYGYLKSENLINDYKNKNFSIKRAINKDPKTNL